MGRHSRPAPGAARTAGAALARGLPFWTGSVTLAAVVGLCASSLLAPDRPGQPDVQAVATGQVAAEGSTTSDESTTAAAPTSASSSTTSSPSPTSSSSPPTTSVIPSATSSSASETASASSTASTQPAGSPSTTVGTAGPESGSPAPSTPAASSPVGSPTATAGPFDPGPIAAPSGLQSTPSTAGDRSRPAAERSRPAATSPPDTGDRRRHDDDRSQLFPQRRQVEPVVAVAARRFASVLTDDQPGIEFLTLRSTASSGDGQPGDFSSSDADDTAEAVAPPTPSQSSAERSSDAEAADQAPPDAADVHLHIDPTPMQVAVFLAVFLLGLAAALVGTSTGSTGAHRRR